MATSYSGAPESLMGGQNIGVVFFYVSSYLYRVSQRVLRLINNRTKAFCSISKLLFVLDKGDPTLGFDNLFFSMETKLPKLWELKDKSVLNH